ncbi:MAG: hypothetical protein R6X18_13550 [Chloroflexota bacterium]|jgi:hypothetical protein
MKIFHSLMAGMAFIILLSGCQAFQAGEEVPVRDNLVTFIAAIKSNAEGKIAIKLGVSNAGNRIPADDQFMGTWQLTNAQGDMRAEGIINALPEMVSNEYWLAGWSSELDPGTYQLLWGAPGYGYTTIEFDVITAEGDGVRVGDQRIFFTTADPPSTGN